MEVRDLCCIGVACGRADRRVLSMGQITPKCACVCAGSSDHHILLLWRVMISSTCERLEKGFSHSTTAIWGRVILCGGVVPCAVGRLAAPPALPTDARNYPHLPYQICQAKMSPEVARCPLGVTLPPIENYWSNFFTYILEIKSFKKQLKTVKNK